jgi:hypothetical protein
MQSGFLISHCAPGSIQDWDVGARHRLSNGPPIAEAVNRSSTAKEMVAYSSAPRHAAHISAA